MTPDLGLMARWLLGRAERGSLHPVTRGALTWLLRPLSGSLDPSLKQIFHKSTSGTFRTETVFSFKHGEEDRETKSTPEREDCSSL